MLLKEMELSNEELQFILDTIFMHAPDLPIADSVIEKLTFVLDRTEEVK